MIHVIAEQSTASEVCADGLIGPELIAELAAGAKVVPLVAPPAAPEPRYAPSRKLADFVRCRDLTCRWPGCDHPAFDCDLDHTVPFGDGGPTHATNLKCYCRTHHLVKTFWGWRDQQLPDGTIILTSPAGKTYVTTPGSALLFPDLCQPTADLPAATPVDRCGDRTAMMPRRRRTRGQDRANRIATERRDNRNARMTRRPRRPSFGPAPPSAEEDPAPF